MLSICDVIVVKQKSSTGDGGITLYGWGYDFFLFHRALSQKLQAVFFKTTYLIAD